MHPNKIFLFFKFSSSQKINFLQKYFQVFAIGVLAKDGRLNYDQLRELVTHEDDLIIAADGFDDLNANLFNDLVEIVCRPGCDIEL